MLDVSHDNQPAGPRIGYVVKRFPRLSETFVINELRALVSLGLHVEVFSLLRPEPEQQDALLRTLDLDVTYLPGRDELDRMTVAKRNFSSDKCREKTVRKELKARADDVSGLPPFPGKRHSQCAVLQLQAVVLAALAASRGVTHLHAHFASDAATVAMLASRVSSIPYSMTAHAKDIYHTYSTPDEDLAFLKKKLLAANFTVTVSDYNRRYLDEISGGRATIYRLYNGIDLTQLQAHFEPREDKLIVAVGRLVEKKGFRHLIDACSELGKKQIPFQCVIIGEGPERPSLEAQIEKLELNECISLAGGMSQRQVFEWLQRATVFVLPCVVGRSGDRDGLPTVLLESMALGTPVISTRLAGIPEMIDDGRSGWLATPGSTQSLADTLEKVLTTNAGERRAAACCAREKVERQFSLEDNARTLCRYFSAHGLAEAPVKKGQAE